ncbi:Protein of unknown function [Nocardia amikacinitolerans]|uniref:DUF2599 domain-containing protein n=1 Tax=Nocardia amikacinitolerans TaxID=756689 RepID=A0A285KVH9_9NOCA|nr:Protein of unknown function [Nocardia amikacinitolerans]
MRLRTRTAHDRRTRLARGAGFALLVSVAVAGCGAEEAPTATSSTTVSRTPSPTTSATPTPTSPPIARTDPATPLAAQPTVDPYEGIPLVDHVEWTENVDGRRLLVFPSEAGRRTTYPGSDERAWQEVLAHSPAADAPGMRDQFICHWDWARLVQPNKPSWNLEPWRPAVGYPATVQASCNPGGPER